MLKVIVMLCFRYKRLLIPYNEGELEGRARTKVERHLDRCGQCRADLAAIRSVCSAFLAAHYPAMEPAPDLWARVNARIAAEPQAKRVWLPTPQIASAAAAAVLVVALGLTVIRSGLQIESQAPRPAAGPSSRSEPPAPSEAEAVKAPPADADMGVVHGDGHVSMAATPGAADRLPAAAVPLGDIARAHRRATSSAESKRAELRAPRAASSPAPADYVSEGRPVHEIAVATGSGAAPVRAAPIPRERIAGVGARGEADVSTVGSLERRSDAPGTSRDLANMDVAAAGAPAASCAYFADGHVDEARARRAGDESVVDALNETEDVRAAALFTYP